MWKYFIGVTPYFDKVMQNKEMKQRRLNKNQKLHWRNRFEDMFGPLKALSWGAWRKAKQFFCTKPPIFSTKSWRLNASEKKFSFF